MQSETNRVATQTLLAQVADQCDSSASKLRVKAQKKKKLKLSKQTAAAGSEFSMPLFLRATQAETDDDVRGVCRHLHYLLLRRDDEVELALVKRHSASVRRGRIYAQKVEARTPQFLA